MAAGFEVPIGLLAVSGTVATISTTLNHLLRPQSNIEMARPKNYEKGYYGREFSIAHNPTMFSALLMWMMKHQDLLPRRIAQVITMPEVNYAFNVLPFNKPYCIKTSYGDIYMWIYSYDNSTPSVIGVATKSCSWWKAGWFSNLVTFGATRRRRHNYQRLMQFLKYDVFKNCPILYTDIQTLDETRYANILNKKKQKRDERRRKKKIINKFNEYIHPVIEQRIKEFEASKRAQYNSQYEQQQSYNSDNHNDLTTNAIVTTSVAAVMYDANRRECDYIATDCDDQTVPLMSSQADQ